MFKNLPKKLKILAIAVMAIGCIAALIYAIYLLSWGFYLGAFLVVLASGIFVVTAYALFGLAKVIENTDKIANNIDNNRIDNNKKE